MLNSNVLNGRFRDLSVPITVHVELTSACNEKCRHCYNFWREDNLKGESITYENLTFIIKEFIVNKVFHVILTGGEPFLVFDKLLYSVKEFIKAGISVSVNSNLMLATPERMQALKSAGLDHILTSVNSYNDEINDYIANTPGALKKIMQGIKMAQEAGIRVTPNMIVSEINKDQVYRTGEFLFNNGINKFLANRTIPKKGVDINSCDEFIFDKRIARVMFDDLVRLNNDYGMEVGTCRTVPNCFFRDLNRYSAFVGRGCSAGKKHICINVDGSVHACVHEKRDYGNIYEIGLKGVWHNMAKWRTMDYIPERCQRCHLFNLCNGGCRLVAETYDNISGLDNLCVGADGIPVYNDGITEETLKTVEGGSFVPISPLAFRKEDGFYIFRIVGAKAAFVEDYFAEFLIRCYKNNTLFTIEDIGRAHIAKVASFLREGLIASK